MLAFSIPWGYAADTYGRKFVLHIMSIGLCFKYAFVQLILSFNGDIPLRVVWISALHTMLGGGVPLGNALMYTVISDVVPESRRYIPCLI